MKAHFRLLALVLALLWVPLTQHCSLEGAGLLGNDPEAHASSCCSGGSDSCAHEVCKVVEDGVYMPGTEILKAPNPSVSPSVCLICLVAIAPPPANAELAPARERTRAPDWQPTWQFVQRAALPARAPSGVS